MGRTDSLKTIPTGRSAKSVDEYDKGAPMLDGELTGFQFGNPVMAALQKAKLAWLRIVSLKKKTLVIHLRLKAELERGFRYDIDREYVAKLKEPNNEVSP